MSIKPEFVFKKKNGENLDRITGLFKNKTGNGWNGKGQDGTRYYLFKNDDGSHVLKSKTEGQEKMQTVTSLSLNPAGTAYTGDAGVVVFPENN